MNRVTQLLNTESIFIFTHPVMKNFKSDVTGNLPLCCISLVYLNTIKNFLKHN